MELHSWTSSFGLASWHRECLAIQTYCKFVGAPITVHDGNNPIGTRDGDLPHFTHGKKVTLHTFDEVVDHLRTVNFDADYSLTPKERAECMAFKRLLVEKFAPAVDFYFWVDAVNAKEFSLPWYGKHLPFPLGWVYPSRYRNRAAERVGCITGVDLTNSETADAADLNMAENHVTRSALECAQLICAKLKDSEGTFFFGTAPTSLDALVYALAAPILRAPTPSQNLRNRLSSYAELVSFVEGISSRYFPRLVSAQGSGSGSDQRTDGGDDDKKDSESSEGGSTVSWFFPAVVAAFAMAAYASRTGLFRHLQFLKRGQ